MLNKSWVTFRSHRNKQNVPDLMSVVQSLFRIKSCLLCVEILKSM